MVYANPAPTAKVSGEYYEAAGSDYYLSPDKLESDYADVRFERELRLFREFCGSGSVLDVGCSSGAFLFQLHKRWPDAYQILGTDVSGAPLAYAESRGVPVKRGRFLEQVFDGCKFDAVTFWAVIEHLAQPNQFLNHTAEVLRAGGLCFVLVPNLRSLAFRLLRSRYRYVYPQHLNYFTARTLTCLCVPRFAVVATRFMHFNPVVLWQDWRSGGSDVSNRERADLLKRTTALKQNSWLAPLKLGYALIEKALAGLGLADNLVLVLRRK